MQPADRARVLQAIHVFSAGFPALAVPAALPTRNATFTFRYTGRRRHAAAPVSRRGQAGAAPNAVKSPPSSMGTVSRDSTANSSHNSPKPTGIIAKPAQS